MRIVVMLLALFALINGAGVLTVPAEHEVQANPEEGITWVNSWLALLIVSGMFWGGVACLAYALFWWPK